MSDETAAADAAAIAAAAEHAVAAARGLPADATLHAPMPVRSLAGAFDHWCVPVLSGSRIVAFVRFTARGELHGLSSFVRTPADVQTSPQAADWIDPSTVRRRAVTLRHDNETVGEPFLSFDGAPDRLAWAVPLSSGRGRRWIFVAGEAAWSTPSIPLGDRPNPPPSSK